MIWSHPMPVASETRSGGNSRRIHERTPSCMIDYRRMLWVCLGCGRGGGLDYYEYEGKRVLSLLGTVLIEGIPERSKAKIRDEHFVEPF